MTFSRKTFLQGMGAGLLGLGVSRLLADGSVSSLPALPDYGGALDPKFWRAVQDAYRFESGLRYFNTGGLGPTAEIVRAAMLTWEEKLARRVESGHHHLEEARASMASFVDCEKSEIAFVRNATEANGIVAAGLDLQPGDEVIFESHAHPGGSFPWLQQARRRGVALRMFEPDSELPQGNIERIQSLMTDRTRVVQVSHVTAPTGLVMPVRGIAELCRRRGIWFHVDGAQSAGMFPFSLREMGCHSYATSGHKWLGAPRETGVLMVRAENQDQLEPPLVGAYSGDVESLPGPLQLTANASRYEYGTRDASRIMGLLAAVEWQERVGREAIATHGKALAHRLREQLEDIADVEVLTPSHPELHASMLTFRSPRLGYSELFGRLWRKHGFRCRPVSERDLNAVRVSCHLFNDTDEVDRLAAAVARELDTA